MKTSISVALLIVITVPVASFAQLNDKVNSNSSAQTQTTFDQTCVATALTIREDALAGAFAKFTQTQTQLLAARKTGLIEALSRGTARERTDARKVVWSAHRTASRANHNELKSARQKAWATYKSSTGQCRGGRAETAGDTTSGSGTEAI